jgi:hypothetical protein
MEYAAYGSDAIMMVESYYCYTMGSSWECLLLSSHVLDKVNINSSKKSPEVSFET